MAKNPNELARMRRLLVITKFGYLGDTIVATPFLRALKHAAPQSTITLLSGLATPSLLAHCPDVTDIWTFDSKSPGRLYRNLPLIQRIRQAHFDAVFLLNRSLHTAMIAAVAGVSRRIGFDTEHRGVLLTDRVPYDWNRPDRDCAFDLLNPFGSEAVPTLPRLWVTDDERDRAQDFLCRNNVEANRLVVGIHAGAHEPFVRQWGAARFAAVAERLAHEQGAQIVLFGSAEERPVAEEVARALSFPAANLAGQTTLREAFALLSHCALWIGNDGGMLHAAVGLGAATLGIFGPTKAARWGYTAPQHRTMVTYPPAYRPGQKLDAKTIRHCLDSIEPDDVYTEALAALAASPKDFRLPEKETAL